MKNNLIFDEVKSCNIGQQACVCIDKKWGVINNQGELIIKPKYGDIYEVSVNYFAVQIQGKWGVIDIKENIILAPQYGGIWGSTLGENLFTVELNKKMSVVDINNNIVFDINYQDNFYYQWTGFFIDGVNYISIRQGAKYGLLDSKFKQVLPFEYDSNIIVSDGLAVTSKTDLYGVVNFANETVIPFKYKKLDILGKNTLLAKRISDEKWIILNCPKNK